MKIEIILDSHKQIKVPAYIFNTKISKDAQPITLLIDTGASNTTILQGDAMRLGIDFSKLKPGKGSVGISGPEQTYELEDTVLGFPIKYDKVGLVLVPIKKILVLKPTDEMLKNQDKKKAPLALTLMGTDLLELFHLDYDYPNVSLYYKNN